jgi:fibronectin type 3 domain-containing protein
MKRKRAISKILGILLISGVVLFTGCPEGLDPDGGDLEPDIPTERPATPTGVTATARSSSTIEITWNKVSNADYYAVYRSDSEDGIYEGIGKYGYMDSIYATTYTDGLSPPLSMNTTYYYKVSAYNLAGASEQSSAVSATTDANIPGTPYNVAVEALSAHSVLITWSGVSGAESYNIYRRAGSSTGDYAPAGSSTTTSYTDDELEGSTTYYYTVRAVNSAGEGIASQWASTVTLIDTKKEGVYIGIISFAGDARDLTGGPVFLDAAGRERLTGLLSSAYTIASQPGTALFYSVHHALANLTSRAEQYPDNLHSVNVITLTDGLDNGSTGMSALQPIEDKDFNTDNDYITYLRGEITNRTIGDIPITAYSRGVRGSDVNDTTKFESDLAQLASEGKSEIVALSALAGTFQEIADGLEITYTTSTTFTLKTTLLAPGTRLRMTFDTGDAGASSRYIDGVITRTGTGADLAYSFGDISYAGGLGSDQGAGPISGVIQGTVLNFGFTGIEDYNPSVDSQRARQWTKAPGETGWTQSSEYNIGGAINAATETRSSIIYLVLDSSTSLDESQIGQIRTAMQGFINSLYSQLSNRVPSGVSATAEGSTGIRVSWNAVSGAARYNIYRSTSSTGPYSFYTYTTGTADFIQGLSPGTTYYYKVSASFGAYDSWEGAQSAPASATTRGPAVSGAAATVVDDASISVSWDAVFGAAGYRVYRSTSSTVTYTLAGEPATASFTDTGLSPSTTYYYKVSSSTNGVESSESAVVSATTLFGPSAGISGITYSSAVPGGNPWTLEDDGRYKSPVIGRTVTKERITFTSTANATLVIQLDVSSEAGHGHAFIGQLDNDSATPFSGYYAGSLITGTASKMIVIPVSSPGSHYIDIGYNKDANIDTGSDCAWFKVVITE